MYRTYKHKIHKYTYIQKYTPAEYTTFIFMSNPSKDSEVKTL